MDIDPKLKVQYEAGSEDINFLWNGIRNFNMNSGPMQKYPPYEPYQVVIRDKKNDIIGGILCKLYLKCVFVELLWIDEKYRKQDIGNQLLRHVEDHAKELGCTFIHLDTFSFQAINFYKKYEYEVFGVFDHYPEENIKRYFLKKYL